MSATSIISFQGININDNVVSILVIIFIVHAIGWMQTSSYKQRQELIGQYRVFMGRFHGYSICIVCVLLLPQMIYLERGSLLHRIDGYFILTLSFFSITSVIIVNILDIFIDKHLPMIWKLLSPIGDYLFAFYFLFCAFKSFESLKYNNDIAGHIFWAKRFGNSALITLSTFPLFKRSSKIFLGSQIYGGITAGVVSTILFALDYYNGYSNTFICAKE